ncbi:MAG: hypothetical protein LBS59_03390 [Puniceicoccales bacterium]|jgi:hypothetical protein|nr:hypothetical protein [Puniceicoccales bacterium]
MDTAKHRSSPEHGQFWQRIPWVAVVCALLAHAALFALFGAAAFQTPVALDSSVMQIESAGAQASVREQTDLMDSEPLYLPTPKSYGYESNHGGAVRLDAEAEFPPIYVFQPELRARPGEALPLSPPPPTVDEKPDAAAAEPAIAPLAAKPALQTLLPISHWNVAATLGLQPQPGHAAPPPRQAVLRVENAVTGVVVRVNGAPLEKNISLGLTAVADAAVWVPAAFSYWVDRQGVVGKPVPEFWTDGVLGSGNAELDAAMRAFLDIPGTIPPLPPGYYRIIIGP